MSRSEIFNKIMSVVQTSHGGRPTPGRGPPIGGGGGRLFKAGFPSFQPPADIPPFFPAEIDEVLADYLNLSAKNEVELSIGSFKPDGSFSPGVWSLTAFNDVLHTLQSRPEEWEIQTTHDRVETMEGVFIRRITDLETGTVIFENKRRRRADNVDNPTWGYRISKATEELTTDYDDRDFVPSVIRTRKRFSFRKTDRESIFYGIRFDLTMVKEERAKKRPGERPQRKVTFGDEPDEDALVNWADMVEEDERAAALGDVDPIVVPETPVEWFVVHKNEIEIERDKAIAGHKNAPDFLAAFHAAYALLIMWMNQVTPSADEASMMLPLLTLAERRYAVKAHNFMFTSEIQQKKITFADPLRLFKDYQNKPTNVTINDLLDPRNDFSVTVKLDGTRRFMLITDVGSYFYGPPYDVWKAGEGVPLLQGTLLDGEWYIQGETPVYYVFDILFYKMKDVRQQSFADRLALVKQVVQGVMVPAKAVPMAVLSGFEEEMAALGLAPASSRSSKKGKVVQQKWPLGRAQPKPITTTSQYDYPSLYSGAIQVKKFYNKGTVYDRARATLDEVEETRVHADGLIFQSHLWYQNHHTKKWKPEGQLTIDFLLRPVEGDPNAMWLLVGDRRVDVPFEEMQLRVPGGMFKGEKVEGRVVEAKWTGSTFEIERFREDRDRPNALATAIDVWRDIQHPIPRATIEGDTLQTMRRWHNNKKRDLLFAEFRRGEVLVDIGSGRGGDLSKWTELGLKHVYVVEPNGENLAILNDRASQMKSVVSFDIIPHGIEKTQKVLQEIGETRVDGVASFFSLTYLAKNKKRYQALLATLDALVPPGGQFVGAVMDGVRTRDLLDRDRATQNLPDEEAAEYLTTAFSIYQASTFTEKVTGNEIEITINDPESMVQDQTEWLFYFDPFKEDLEKRGLKLITTGFWDSGEIFDLLPEPAKQFSRLTRYFIFRRSDKKIRAIRAALSVDEQANLPNSYGAPLVYLGAPLNESNVIHAVLEATSRKYRERNPAEREQQAQKLRLSLAKHLTLESFLELHVSQDILRKVVRANPSKKFKKVELQEAAYHEFQAWLKDPTRYLGERTGLELLSKALDTNLILLKPDGDPQKTDSLKDLSHEKTVLLVTIDGIHMYPVGRVDEEKVEMLFDIQDPLIQAIIKRSK